MAATETIKHSIATWLPRASVASPGTMLQLFGGVSQTIGRFGPLAVAVGAAAAFALSAMLVLGVIAERRRELAVLRVLGWQEAQVRRQLAAEMAVQGLLGGLLSLALIALGAALMARVAIFAAGGVCQATIRSTSRSEAFKPQAAPYICRSR